MSQEFPPTPKYKKEEFRLGETVQFDDGFGLKRGIFKGFDEKGNLIVGPEDPTMKDMGSYSYGPGDATCTLEQVKDKYSPSSKE